MRPPRFWYAPNGRRDWRAVLLAPIGWLAAIATARRVKRRPKVALPIPVICVGNINLGGTGKTPVVIALVQFLQERGMRPAVISRGYGGNLEGPIAVDPARHTATETGDEPLLIAAFAPVWVGKNRDTAALAAFEAGAEIVIMDDGHQNPDVHKDLSLVVVDGNRGFGNGRCFPAGPLREPPSTGVARADAIISVGPPGPGLSSFLHAVPKKPLMTATLKPLKTGMDWKGTRVLAFAGIGHPEKFFETLRDLGADLCSTIALDDHQEIQSTLWARISADADRLGAQLVTTEKDAVRLTSAQRETVLALPVRLEFDTPDALANVLAPLLGQPPQD